MMHPKVVYSVFARFHLKSLRIALFVASLVLTFRLAQAQKSELAENPVFASNCAKCHGKTAEGRMFAGPSLASPKVVAASTDELRNIITNGRRRMPKFGEKLTAEQIDRLVGQIKALSKK